MTGLFFRCSQCGRSYECLPPEPTDLGRDALRTAWDKATKEYLAAPPGIDKDRLGEKADALCFKVFRDVSNGVPRFPLGLTTKRTDSEYVIQCDPPCVPSIAA